MAAWPFTVIAASYDVSTAITFGRARIRPRAEFDGTKNESNSSMGIVNCKKTFHKEQAEHRAALAKSEQKT